MKKIFIFFILALSVFSKQAFAESISNYQVDMQLHKDSSVLITEMITYDFDEKKHGIFRFIPVFLNVAGQDNERLIDIELLSVKRDGQKENYTVDPRDSNDNYFIKIGNAGITISGSHVYEIQYVVNGSIRYFEDLDEIYWNAISDQWEVPISNIKVTVTSDQIPFEKYSCYKGRHRSISSCDKIESVINTKVEFTQNILGTGEGLTVATSFPKGSVDVVEKTELDGLSQDDIKINRSHIYLGLLLIMVVAILIPILFIFCIQKLFLIYRNKYKTYDPIHPRYEPPVGVSVLFMGHLVDKAFDARDIAASIIQLARDGYIDIEQIEDKDYIFTLKKTPLQIKESENKELIAIVNMLFAQIDLYSKDKINKIGIKRNMSNVPLDSASKHRSKLASFLYKRSIDEEYIESIDFGLKNTLYITIAVALSWYTLYFFEKYLLLIIAIFCSIVAVIFVTLYSARYTTKGWQAKHDIEGFKVFLEMTEKDRLDFHNAPGKNPDIFMKYLPYAIALGVEKKWSQQFKGMLATSPDWFVGGDVGSSIVFANSLSNFLNGLNRPKLSSGSSSSRRMSSDSRSGSGSGGGGFSGGGSGGGGGGSW